ncbi:hypothetical protein NGRA_1468 [Nosema granulosis]|uniref:Polar tube protein 3 n=1 Tax=Nosema granulosis TaxID=83296 RepID=A0A9P6KZ33_9MICR|nr:hypothetical protein NGRA_1468 [Nosema granulosis]
MINIKLFILIYSTVNALQIRLVPICQSDKLSGPPLATYFQKNTSKIVGNVNSVPAYSQIRKECVPATTGGRVQAMGSLEGTGIRSNTGILMNRGNSMVQGATVPFVNKVIQNVPVKKADAMPQRQISGTGVLQQKRITNTLPLFTAPIRMIQPSTPVKIVPVQMIPVKKITRPVTVQQPARIVPIQHKTTPLAHPIPIAAKQVPAQQPAKTIIIQSPVIQAPQVKTVQKQAATHVPQPQNSTNVPVRFVPMVVNPHKTPSTVPLKQPLAIPVPHKQPQFIPMHSLCNMNVTPMIPECVQHKISAPIINLQEIPQIAVPQTIVPKIVKNQGIHDVELIKVIEGISLVELRKLNKIVGDIFSIVNNLSSEIAKQKQETDAKFYNIFHQAYGNIMCADNPYKTNGGQQTTQSSNNHGNVCFKVICEGAECNYSQHPSTTNIPICSLGHMQGPCLYIDNNQQTVPQQTVPQQTVPQQTVPQQTVPQQTVPQQIVPQQIVPQQTVPQQIVPQQIVPQQALPLQIVPQQALPQQASNVATNTNISCTKGSNDVVCIDNENKQQNIPQSYTQNVVYTNEQPEEEEIFMKSTITMGNNESTPQVAYNNTGISYVCEQGDTECGQPQLAESIKGYVDDSIFSENNNQNENGFNYQQNSSGSASSNQYDTEGSFNKSGRSSSNHLEQSGDVSQRSSGDSNAAQEEEEVSAKSSSKLESTKGSQLLGGEQKASFFGSGASAESNKESESKEQEKEKGTEGASEQSEASTNNSKSSDSASKESSSKSSSELGMQESGNENEKGSSGESSIEKSTASNTKSSGGVEESSRSGSSSGNSESSNSSNAFSSLEGSSGSKGLEDSNASSSSTRFGSSDESGSFNGSGNSNGSNEYYNGHENSNGSGYSGASNSSNGYSNGSVGSNGYSNGSGASNSSNGYSNGSAGSNGYSNGSGASNSSNGHYGGNGFSGGSNGSGHSEGSNSSNGSGGSNGYSNGSGGSNGYSNVSGGSNSSNGHYSGSNSSGNSNGNGFSGVSNGSGQVEGSNGYSNGSNSSNSSGGSNSSNGHYGGSNSNGNSNVNGSNNSEQVEGSNGYSNGSDGSNGSNSSNGHYGGSNSNGNSNGNGYSNGSGGSNGSNSSNSSGGSNSSNGHYGGSNSSGNSNGNGFSSGSNGYSNGSGHSNDSAYSSDEMLKDNFGGLNSAHEHFNGGSSWNGSNDKGSNGGLDLFNNKLENAMDDKDHSDIWNLKYGGSSGHHSKTDSQIGGSSSKGDSLLDAILGTDDAHSKAHWKNVLLEIARNEPLFDSYSEESLGSKDLVSLLKKIEASDVCSGISDKSACLKLYNYLLMSSSSYLTSTLTSHLLSKQLSKAEFSNELDKMILRIVLSQESLKNKMSSSLSDKVSSLARSYIPDNAIMDYTPTCSYSENEIIPEKCITIMKMSDIVRGDKYDMCNYSLKNENRGSRDSSDIYCALMGPSEGKRPKNTHVYLSDILT